MDTSDSTNASKFLIDTIASLDISAQAHAKIDSVESLARLTAIAVQVSIAAMLLHAEDLGGARHILDPALDYLNVEIKHIVDKVRALEAARLAPKAAQA